MGQTILVVDGDPDTITPLRLYLEKTGYALTIVDDVKTAVGIARHERLDLLT